MARRTKRFWTIALLLPALLAAGVGRGYQVYRCRVDRIARVTCCCPTADEPRADGRDTTIGGGCCCDREVVTLAASVSHTESPACGPPVDHPVALVSPPPLRPTVSRLPARRAPAGVGPPLLLLKRSFLI